mgnify:CR=1 FL=1
MIRRPPRSTLDRSSAASDVYKRQVYGLPEVNREAIRGARIVGNPGCYPTAVQLGFLPLLEAGIVDTGHLIADCKSGVSGAGRKAEVGLLFAEASDNFKAYGVSGHRHHPETEARLQEMTSDKVSLLFTPHLVPMNRGMHSTLYTRLNSKGLAFNNEQVQALFADAYRNEPFVDVMPFASMPDTRSTRGSNTLRIALHRPQGGDTLIVPAGGKGNAARPAKGRRTGRAVPGFMDDLVLGECAVPAFGPAALPPPRSFSNLVNEPSSSSRPSRRRVWPRWRGACPACFCWQTCNGPKRRRWMSWPS